MSNDDADRRAPTGRALDALIAEKVMGLPYVRVVQEEEAIWLPDVRDWADTGDRMWGEGEWGSITWHLIPHYSSDIAAAWQVIDHLRARGIWLHSLQQLWEGQSARVIFEWRETARGLMHAQAWEDTPPLAICMAALAAVRAGGITKWHQSIS